MQRRGSLCSRRVKSLRAASGLAMAGRIHPATENTGRMTELTLGEVPYRISARGGCTTCLCRSPRAGGAFGRLLGGPGTHTKSGSV